MVPTVPPSQLTSGIPLLINSMKSSIGNIFSVFRLPNAPQGWQLYIGILFIGMIILWFLVKFVIPKK